MDKKRTATYSLLLLAFFFLTLRLVNIGDLQPFTDEAGNILSSIDPKTKAIIDPMGLGRPLLSYEFKIANLDPSHALELARSLIAVISLLSALCFFFILKNIFNSRIALAGFGLWCISSYHVAHERLALQDPITTFFLLIMTLFLVKSLKLIKEDQNFLKPIIFVLFAGFCFALSFLNKISSINGIIWPLGLLLIYINKHDIKISKAQLTVCAFIFVSSFSLFVLSQARILEIGTTMLEASFITKISSPLSFIENYIFNLIQISEHYYNWSKGYAGPFFTVVIIYLLIQTPFQKDLVQKKLWAILLLYIAINAVTYDHLMFARYIHHETVIIISLVIYSLHKIYITSSKKLLKRIEKIFLSLFLFLAIYENILTDISLVKESHKAWLSQKTWDYRQYTSRAWSGNGLQELEQFINQTIKNDPSALFIVTSKFEITHYGLKLKYYQTEKAKKLLPLELNSNSTAAGLVYYKKLNKLNNLYLILGISEHAITHKSTEFLAKNLQAQIQKIAVIKRGNYYDDVFAVYKISTSYYQPDNSLGTLVTNFPNISEPKAIIDFETLKHCPLKKIQLRSYANNQSIKLKTKQNLNDQIIDVENKFISLIELGMTKNHLPISLIANHWVLENIESSYDKQEVRALEIVCIK